MRKLFFYELRRTLFNKFFAGLLLICLCFAWQTLTAQTILGVAHTAPFSPWSFGSYLSTSLPLLCIALLFFLWRIFSGSARDVEVLTAATPMKPSSYLLVKYAAILTAWLLLACSVTALGLVFFTHLFGPVFSKGILILPIVVFLPPLMFILGLGSLVGRRWPALLFVLAPCMLAVGLCPLPYAAQLFGAGFFARYPLLLPTLDPPFSLPGDVILGKFVYLLLGALFFAYALKNRRRPS